MHFITVIDKSFSFEFTHKSIITMYSKYFITEMSQGFMPLLTHMIVNYCTYITVKPADLRAHKHTHTHTFHTHSHKETMHWHFLWAECGIIVGLSHHAYSNTGKWFITSQATSITSLQPGLATHCGAEVSPLSATILTERPLKQCQSCSGKTKSVTVIAAWEALNSNQLYGEF